MKSQIYTTNYTVDECFNLLNEHLQISVGKNAVCTWSLKKDKLVFLIKNTNFNSVGLYKNAYKKLVCRFGNKNTQTALIVNLILRKRDLLTCLATIAIFVFSFLKPIIITYQTNNIKGFVASVSTMIFFIVICVLLLYISLWVHKKSEKQLLEFVLTLLKCIEVGCRNF